MSKNQRIQISAILNMSGADTDGLLRLLAEKAEHVEFKRLDTTVTEVLSNKKKPKVYVPSMMIQLANSDGLIGQRLEVWTALHKKYGNKPFRKGDVKQYLVDLRVKSPSSVMTQLMNSKNIVEAKKE
jgi:hypothetical protein